MKKRALFSVFLSLSIVSSIVAVAFVCLKVKKKTAEDVSWLVGKPILSHTENGNFDSFSVKDPSIVKYDGKYHIFYTASGNDKRNQEYTIGYVSAEKLENINNSKRYKLEQLKPKNGTYYCAPQVFYYSKHNLWYLIYQIRSKIGSYEAVFSTSNNISDPQSWTSPQKLLSRDWDKNNKNKWIDFWVISDDEQMYLFYASGGKVAFRTTAFDKFPYLWSSETTFSVGDGYEAPHIYKSKKDNKYYMIFEGLYSEKNKDLGRKILLATSDNLNTNHWSLVNLNWANVFNMNFRDKNNIWTDMPSHGELLRSGCNEKCELTNIDSALFLIQGVKLDAYARKYSLIPWSLGLMRIQ